MDKSSSKKNRSQDFRFALLWICKTLKDKEALLPSSILTNDQISSYGKQTLFLFSLKRETLDLV